MSYNYKKEYAKWKKWKDKEEALLNINSIQIEGL